MERKTHILLDCDGVLVDSERLALVAELRVLSEIGLGLSDEQYSEITLGLSEDEHLRLLNRELTRAGIAVDQEDLAKNLHAARWSVYESSLQLVDGIKPILYRYKEILTLVSASEPRSISKKLALVGLEDFFGERVFGAENKDEGKTAIFERALSSLNLAPSECLAIEDSEAGVNAAMNTGIEVWALISASPVGHSDVAGRLVAAGASRVFLDARSLVEAVESVFG